MNEIVEIDYKNLDETISKHSLSVIYFWSPGCGVCRYTGPIFESLPEEYDKVLFGKVNTNENVETYTMLGITGVPTIKLYRDGLTVDTIVGCKDYMKVKQTYKEKIEELING